MFLQKIFHVCIVNAFVQKTIRFVFINQTVNGLPVGGVVPFQHPLDDNRPFGRHACCVVGKHDLDEFVLNFCKLLLKDFVYILKLFLEYFSLRSDSDVLRRQVVY